MIIEPKLKPLYANLKRIEIGEYLNTKDFELLAIESNFDNVWEDCKTIINRKKTVIMLGYHNSEDEEEAFLHLMNLWYEQSPNSFGNFITVVLINFMIWHSTKTDISSIQRNLKQIGLSEKELLEFDIETKRINSLKSEKVVEKILETSTIPKVQNNSRKVFIVHGHDDKAVLQLSKILKEDLSLEPIVLKEEPNVSLETIITKFERLASECSSAIILFTPDDNSEGKFRARQNVILELGYFLGKFHENENRRIAIIKTGDIEIPSDISGVLYLEYHKLVKELYYDLKKQFNIWGYE